MLCAAPSPDEIVELASESVLNSTGTWYKPVLRKLSVLCTKSFDADRIVGEESEEGDNDKDRVALPLDRVDPLKDHEEAQEKSLGQTNPWTVPTH